MLHSKVVVITGAGRGIGRAIALAFAGAGAQVALLARSEGELQQVAAEIGEAGGASFCIPCDVSDAAAVEAAFHTVQQHWGGLDMLVNNAGYAVFKPFDALSYADWRQTMDINLDAAFHCIQAALPHMKRRGGGRILNISSVSGLKGIEHQSAYCAAKHALNGLTKALAIELRPHNISVHALCPGAVATRLALEAMPERDVSDWMTPEDVAHTALYLATLPEGATVDILHLRRFNSGPL